jgi:hypothetical protein
MKITVFRNSIELIRGNRKIYTPNGIYDHKFLFERVVETMYYSNVNSINIKFHESFTAIETDALWLDSCKFSPSKLLTEITDFPAQGEFPVRGEVLAAALSEWVCIGFRGNCYWSGEPPSRLVKQAVVDSVRDMTDRTAIICISRALAKIDEATR